MFQYNRISDTRSLFLLLIAQGPGHSALRDRISLPLETIKADDASSLSMQENLALPSEGLLCKAPKIYVQANL